MRKHVYAVNASLLNQEGKKIIYFSEKTWMHDELNPNFSTLASVTLQTDAKTAFADLQQYNRIWILINTINKMCLINVA